MMMPPRDARFKESMTGCGSTLEMMLLLALDNTSTLDVLLLLVSVLEEDLLLSVSLISWPPKSSKTSRLLLLELLELETKNGLNGLTV